MNEQPRVCPTCGRYYRVASHYCGWQGACMDCRAKIERECDETERRNQQTDEWMDRLYGKEPRDGK